MSSSSARGSRHHDLYRGRRVENYPFGGDRLPPAIRVLNQRSIPEGTLVFKPEKIAPRSMALAGLSPGRSVRGFF